jgi:hypothetical protein
MGSALHVFQLRIFIPPLCAKCPAHLNLLDLVTVTVKHLALRYSHGKCGAEEQQLQWRIVLHRQASFVFGKKKLLFVTNNDNNNNNNTRATWTLVE